MLETNFGPLAHMSLSLALKTNKNQKQNTYFAITYHDVVGFRLRSVV